MAKKKVVAASVLSTEAFPTAGLALWLELPTVATSIPGPKVGEDCWNSSLDAHLEVVAASIQLEMMAGMSKSARLRETLPTISWVLDP